MEIPHSKLNSLLRINFIFGKFVSISLLNEKIYETLPILYLFINMLTNIIYSHPQRRCASCYVIMHDTSLHYKALQHEMYRCLSLSVLLMSEFGLHHKLQSATRLTGFGTKTQFKQTLLKGVKLFLRGRLPKIVAGATSQQHFFFSRSVLFSNSVWRFKCLKAATGSLSVCKPYRAAQSRPPWRC